MELILAAKQNNVKKVREILRQKDIDVNYSDSSAVLFLYFASRLICLSD